MTRTSADPPDFIARSERLRAAFDLARAAHRDQQRKDGGAYVGHPLAVARILAEAGTDEATLAAALLHDVVEDSEVGVDEIARRFGAEVAELVGAMTENAAIADWEQRKDRHRDEVRRAGARAVAIYAADKLANARDVRAAYAREGEAVAERFEVPLGVRARHWRRDLEMARDVAPMLSFLDELGSELDGFDGQRRRDRANVS